MPPVTASVALEHRVYLNGFPKAGLHLAERWIQSICAPAVAEPWLGTFADNAWGVTWAEHVDKMPAVFAGMPSGYYLKGHSGWLPELAEALYSARVATFFIYRDLRDVAVSAAYHVLDRKREPDGRYSKKHFDKGMFRGMSFEDVLIDMIRGRGKHCGVIERWRLYENWLRERWVCKVSFEAMRDRAQSAARHFLRYVFGISGQWAGVDVELDRQWEEETVNQMIDAGLSGSRTLRKGKPGAWREHWTPKVRRAWEEVKGPAVNAALGYEAG